MSLVEGEDLHEIARKALKEELAEHEDVEIRSSVDYPLYNSDNFNKKPSFGTLDIVGIGDEIVAGFSVSDTVSELNRVINEVSAAQSYFEKEGFKPVFYRGIVDDNSLLEFKEAAEELPPIFKQSTLEEHLENPGDQRHFYNSGLLGELHTIPRRGFETNQRVLHRNDYEMLENNNLIEERNGVYFPTETMDTLLASSEDILHVTPRESAVYHPEELDYE